MNTAKHTFALAALAGLLAFPLLTHAQPEPDAQPGRGRREEARPRQGPRPERADQERGAGARDAHPVIERWMRHLEETAPEDHQRLQELRESDPGAFRQELRRSMASARQESGAATGRRRHPVADQAAAVRVAETEAEREAAVAALRESVETMIDRRMAMREQRIETVRAQLERLEAEHEADKARRDELVTRMMDRLLTEPEAGETSDE